MPKYIAHPITKYLKKNSKININDPNYIAAFEKLKDIITHHPILKYPNFSKKFKLITDASNFAVGSVLTQDGHPVCYASRTLNEHEKNYSVIEKELLAIVWGVKYFRPYLFGKEFDLQTDHQPIKWLQTKYAGKDINPRLQRWLIQLGEYNINIDYIKGKDNKVADFLSRININNKEINAIETIDNGKGEYSTENLGINSQQNSLDTENLSIAFKDTFTDSVENLNTTEQVNEVNESTEVETIHSQEENMNDHIPILETVANRFKTQIIFQEKKEKDYEKIFKNTRIYIDKGDLINENVSDILRRYINKGKVGIYSELDFHEYNELQKKIIELFPSNKNVKFIKCSFLATDIDDEEQLKKQISLFHKNELGHSGIIATYEGIKTKIYNPNLKIRVHEIINNCDICSASKYDRNPIKKKFQLTETPSTTNEIVHVDIYVNSKHSFINFIDKFSKIATSFYLEDRNSQTIVEKLKQFISIRGKIKKFIFDNEFKSKNVCEFCKKENIEFHITKPNNHTGNSDVERLNNTLTERIRALNIEEKLPIRTQMLNAITYYNSSYHSTIKATPLEVQEKQIDHKIIKERMEQKKQHIINRRNASREDYTETRNVGYIKHYKSLRHKEEPKFRKQNLENVHENNIKRPFKFSDQSSNRVDSVTNGNAPGTSDINSRKN